MATLEITLPDFDFSGLYYPEILEALIRYQRVNIPEITDEDEHDPFQQLLRAFALVAHHNNVLLDIVATETLIPTARLLESVRSHLALIDVTLRQASPAITDVVIEFSKVFIVATDIVPIDSQFATEETDENPQVIFETNANFTIQPTDRFDAIFCYTSGLIQIINNAFDAGDGVVIEGISFIEGTDWSAGGSIALSVQALVDAINTSTNTAIFDQVYAIHDGVDKISVIPLDPSIEVITITEIDGATDNFTISSAAFGANNSGLADLVSTPFDLFTTTPKAGDIIYFNHADIMWDLFEFVFNSFGSGITGVWEFYDADLDDEKPDSVTNLGSNLEFDLTTILGSSNRSGAVIRVVYSTSGASEIGVSIFSSGTNLLRTRGLLGQSSVDVDEQNYVVGSYWAELSNIVDGTSSFTVDGEIEFDLPQSITQNWITLTQNSVAGMWLRFRVISVAAPTNPSIDLIHIDSGKQYLLTPVSQGESVAEDPLGSSLGAVDQKFELTHRPLIEGTLTIEVNEGSGFTAWNLAENFLNSSSVAKDYTLTIKGDDTAIITFGDGTKGKIPVAGSNNIRAVYRIGADIDGNVGANTISVNKSGIGFVANVFNPRQATGWSVKEGSTDADLARIKIEGPATLRTREKAITPDDIEFLATQFIDANGSNIVSRALAIEETFGVKTIELVVVGQAGVLLTEAQRDDVKDFFNGNKAKDIKAALVTNHEVTVVNYTPKLIDVTVVVTGGVKAEIENAIKAILNPDATFSDGVTKRWSFSDTVPLAVINSAIFEVDPTVVKNAVFALPVGDTILTTKELPLAGTVNVTVI